MKHLIWTCWVALIGAPEVCLEVSGVHVLAGELAKKAPGFGHLAPETVVLPSPLPGVRRLMSPADLKRLAGRFEVEAEGMPLCIVRSGRILREREVETAVRAAIIGRGEEIEQLVILDHHRLPVPDGELEMPWGGLAWSGGDRFVWRGRVRSGNNRTTAVWVRFRCRVKVRGAVARTDLRAGQPLLPDAVESAVWPEPLRHQRPARLQEITGQTLKRPVSAGKAIYAADLVAQAQVRAGQPTRVRVQGQHTVLEFEAKPVRDGRHGERIPLENPANKRRFFATVTGPQQVQITLQGAVRP